MVIPIIRNCTTSADTGPWTKNIPGQAAGVCHHAPQLAITCCRKQLLIQQEAHAQQVAPSAPKNILMEARLTVSTLPLISVSCKYHLRLPADMAQEDVQPHNLLSAQKLSWCYCLPTWRLHGNVRWLLGQYTDAYSGDRGPTNQSLTITCICPLRVRARCCYAVAVRYRSRILYFPGGRGEKLKSALSIVST